MVDEFHHSLRVTVGEEPVGYYADFEQIYHLAKTYIDAYAYDGQFSAVRQKRFGRKAEHNPGHQFIVFSQNHDQVGNRKGGERSSYLYSYEKLKLMAGTVLFSPFIPLLFMGEEWGETNPFFYFVHHSDPTLIEAVRTGRREEFASFYTDEAMPDPQSEETFWHSKLQWSLPARQPHQTLLRYYQYLIALRRQLPALHQLSRRHLTVIPDEACQTLVLHRWAGEQHVLCVMNFSVEPRSVQLPGDGGRWQKLLDSADEAWQNQAQAGTGTAPEWVSGTEEITLQPESIVLYGQGPEPVRVSIPEPIPAELYQA